MIARRALLYSDGADPATDRPAHVRAASGLARFRGGLAIAQDDASFLALVTDTRVDALALPSDDGVRQFDDARGNKRRKLDLESIVSLEHGGRERLLAFGSGSLPSRRRVAIFDGGARLVDADAFYAAFPRDFVGADPNLEGAVAVGDDLVLLQRGNGAPTAIDATARVSIAALLAFLDGRGAPPALFDVRPRALGEVDGCRLGFTDTTLLGAHAVFSAAAEASPDATLDGPVAGVALGVLDDAPAPRWTLVRDASGAPLLAKIEGVAPHPEPDRLWAVVDVDDATRPSELLLLALEGFPR